MQTREYFPAISAFLSLLACVVWLLLITTQFGLTVTYLEAHVTPLLRRMALRSLLLHS